jgi:predicted Rossmann fold flavoprotein
VPVTLSSGELARFGPLSGLAVETVARCGTASFPEAVLFTHRGLSGPAILQISSHWRVGETFQLDLLPQLSARSVFQSARRSARTPAQVLAEHWPKRFVEAWCGPAETQKPLAQWSDAALAELLDRLHGWPITPTGTEGFPKAEVTLGGVDTRALSSKTMEVRDVPGLFFIGEVVDVTGWLGGFNFQWAWASAQAAGAAV